MIKTYIPRPKYMGKLRPYLDKDVIKVIVGQRRVGKSYFLFQIMDEIKRSGASEAQMVYVDKELHEFENIKTYKDLISFVQSTPHYQRKKTYVFIDEVQEIEQFEKALRHLHAKGNYDLYCTGSNAYLLSSELATLLSGRQVTIEMYALSYPEFLTFHSLPDTNETLLQFLKYGGLPYLRNLALEDAVVFDYVRNIYNTILFRDVVSRWGVRNIHFLERLVEYLADNVGSIVSAKKVSDFLRSQRTKMSPNVVLQYLSHLVAAFFVYKVPRADIQGKRIFEVNDKYYFGDLGLRHAIVGYRQVDINKILENAVFLHLKMAGYKVMIGKLGDREIDFVCDRGGEKLYVQVAYLIESEKTKEREFGPLLTIPDNYPKMVVSMDESASGDVKGVQHLHVRKFLSEITR